MSDPSSFLQRRSNRIGDFLEDPAGVYLRDLPPLTTVRPDNELPVSDGRYSLARGLRSGGRLLCRPTAADVDGATSGGSCLRAGWIGVGLLMEIRSGGWRITTSPVVAITTEQAANLPVAGVRLSLPRRSHANHAPFEIGRHRVHPHKQQCFQIYVSPLPNDVSARFDSRLRCRVDMFHRAHRRRRPLGPP